MRGKWIFIAFAASLGTMAAFCDFHWAAIALCILFLVWIWMKDLLNHTLFVICVISICLFAVLYQWADDHNYSNFTGSETQFTGIIKTIPVIDGNRLSFIFENPSKEKFSLSYTIRTLEQKESLEWLQVGMTCTFTGKLTIPDKARNYFAFDYQKFLYYKQIHWIVAPSSLSPTQCVPSSPYQFLLQKWRSSQLTYIKNHFPENTVGFVQALIFGDRNEMSQSVEDSFQQFGLIHLLAISGSHVVLIVAISFFIFVRIGITRERAFLLLFMILPFYIIMTGASPSVVRACLVSMLVLLSIPFRRKFPPLDALSIVFLLMMMKNPYYITDIGFQLSFLVSFSLIVSSSVIISRYENYWLQLIIVTTIAQLSSLPLVLFYNFEISLLSLPFNIIFVPLVSIIILPISFFAYIFSYISESLAAIPMSLLTAFIDYSIYLLEETKKISTVTFIFGKPSMGLLIAYFIGVGYFFICWEKEKQIIKAKKALMLLCFLFLYHWYSPFFSNEGKITMIDVGQGDSILIELPYRKAVYLIDTGGAVSFQQEDWQQRKNRFDVGENIITPLLKAKGIRIIDKLILTHGDMDHIGGTAALLNYFKIKETIIGAGNHNRHDDGQENDLYKKITLQNISIKTIKAGDSWKKDDYSFYAIGPTGNETSKNNQSVVLYSQLGGLRWLFTGDLEEEGENKVLQQFPNLQADVLKIGHHGSNSSTSERFIAQIKPIYALISVGENNRFGHPHSDVVELLTNHNIQILRTDVNGSICFKFKGNKGTFEWLLP